MSDEDGSGTAFSYADYSFAHKVDETSVSLRSKQLLNPVPY